ncbi:MAG: AMP-binding protein, partial [Ornithinimicrobium sp.]
MQDIAVPPLVPLAVDGNLSDVAAHWAGVEPTKVLVRIAEGETWRDVSAAEFWEQVQALAKGFVAAGVPLGARVAIMSRTRYEWTLADFALWTAGAVPVPVYETSSAEQLEWICADSQAGAIDVEDSSHAATVARVRDSLEHLNDVWQIDSGALEELVSAGAE